MAGCVLASLVGRAREYYCRDSRIDTCYFYDEIWKKVRKNLDFNAKTTESELNRAGDANMNPGMSLLHPR